MWYLLFAISWVHDYNLKKELFTLSAWVWLPDVCIADAYTLIFLCWLLFKSNINYQMWIPICTYGQEIDPVFVGHVRDVEHFMPFSVL